VLKGGRPVPLFDADPEAPLELVPGGRFRPHDPGCGRAAGGNLENVFIDTGENGIFSLEEFAAITTSEQMEFVTPEEIADVVAQELLGGNTGHDVVNALDNAVMGPTYRAGLMRHWALEKLRELEERHGVQSVAFENLGPPRLSKLLFEADLLRRVCDGMAAARQSEPGELSRRVAARVAGDAVLRRQILSIGIPILLPDGRLLRGPECKIPPASGPDEALEITLQRVETWARDGWGDLRPANMALWRDRLARVEVQTRGAFQPERAAGRFVKMPGDRLDDMGVELFASEDGGFVQMGGHLGHARRSHLTPNLGKLGQTWPSSALIEN